jgi:cysteine desulfurase
MTSTLVDLDHNATTRPLPEVVEAYVRASELAWGNPGSRHGLGRKARVLLENSREEMAAILGAFPDELIFTSGGTEANNLALRGLIRGSSGLIGLTAGEHPCVVETCRDLANRGFTLEWLPVDSAGRISRCAIEELLDRKPTLVTCILAHNETGVIQELAPIAMTASAMGIPFHVDGVQAVGKLPVSFRELGVTSLAFAAHKFHGPRGIGGLLVRRGAKLNPLLLGGHQESEKRPGTEAVPLVAAMATALSLWHRDSARRTATMLAARDRLEASLLARCAPAFVNGAEATRLPNTSNIAFPGVDGEALLVALDLVGIACSLGSTCASGSTEPAPALVAMGLPRERIAASVRFSVGCDNRLEEIDDAVDRIATVVTRLRST